MNGLWNWVHLAGNSLALSQTLCRTTSTNKVSSKPWRFLCIGLTKERLGGEQIIPETRSPVRAIVELWRLSIAPEDIPNGLPHSGRRQWHARWQKGK
jgi:uncharacterized protein (DUF433 family)